MLKIGDNFFFGEGCLNRAPTEAQGRKRDSHLGSEARSNGR